VLGPMLETGGGWGCVEGKGDVERLASQAAGGLVTGEGREVQSIEYDFGIVLVSAVFWLTEWTFMLASLWGRGCISIGSGPGFGWKRGATD